MTRRQRLSAADAVALYLVQGGRCAVCLEPLPRRFVEDHDPATGQPRGLLCHRCNIAEGLDRAGVALRRPDLAEALGRYREVPPARGIGTVPDHPGARGIGAAPSPEER